MSSFFLGWKGRLRPLALAAATALVAVPVTARAEPTQADLAASDAHVREARRLRQRGRIMEACAEYDQADRDYPRAEILRELADCYDVAGYPGTAWEALQRAELLSKGGKGGTRPVDGAGTRVTNLSRLGRVRFDIDRSVDRSLLEIKIDGHRIPPSSFDTAHPVDPELLTLEAHQLVASVDGYVPQTWQFRLGPAEERTFKIGPFEPTAETRAAAGAVPLDRPDDAPTATPGVDGGVRFRAAASILSGVYTVPGGSNLRPGDGEFAIATARLTMSYRGFSVLARASVVHVFRVPGSSETPTIVGTPTIGASYRFALSKQFGLSPAVTFVPPLTRPPANPAEVVGTRVGNLSGGQTYSPLRAAVQPGVALDGRFGRLSATLGLIVNAGIQTRTEEVSMTFAERVQVTYLVLTWLRPYLDTTFVHPGITPTGAPDPLGLAAGGGVAFILGQSAQLSLGIVKPLTGILATLEPTMVDVSASVTF